MLTVFHVLAWCASGALTLGAALRTSRDSLRLVRHRPGLILRALLVGWIGVPMLALLITTAFDLRGVGGATLLLMAICPGVPALLASTRKVNGAMDTALVLLIVMSVTAPLLTPLWAQILSVAHPLTFSIEPRQVIVTLLATVFAPLVVGLLIRLISARAAAVLARVSHVLWLAGIGFAAVAILPRGAPLLLHVPLPTFIAAVLIMLGASLMGYWAGRPDMEDRQATTFAAALGNPALALAVVAASYPEYKAGALCAAYVALRLILLIPIRHWLKEHTTPKARAASPAT